MSNNFKDDFCNQCKNKKLCEEKWDYCQQFQQDQCNNNPKAKNKCEWDWVGNNPNCCCIPIEGFDKPCEI